MVHETFQQWCAQVNWDHVQAGLYNLGALLIFQIKMSGSRLSDIAYRNW